MKVFRLVIVFSIIIILGCSEDEFYEDSYGYNSNDYRIKYTGVYNVRCSYTKNSLTEDANNDIKISLLGTSSLKIYRLYYEAYDHQIQDDAGYLEIESAGNFTIPNQTIEDITYIGSGKFSGNKITYQYFAYGYYTYECDCTGTKQ